MNSGKIGHAIFINALVVNCVHVLYLPVTGIHNGPYFVYVLCICNGCMLQHTVGKMIHVELESYIDMQVWKYPPNRQPWVVTTQD